MNIQDAIGNSKKDDYILAPDSHYELYKDSLPELATLLSDSEISYISTEYQRHDERAIIAQKRYKKKSSYARLTGFLTTLFTVLLIVSGALANYDFGKLPDIIRISSTVLAIIFSGSTVALILMIKNQKLLSKWMEKRAEAEEMRLSYFNELSIQVKDKSVNEQLQVLEYFRRYQLDMQINFYSIRSIEFEKKATKALNKIAILSGLVLIINGIVGSLGFETTFASLAIIVQAVSFMVSNKELSEQNEKNAERYERTRKLLAKLKSEFNKVRQAIFEDKKDALSMYVKAVQEPLSAENRQWLKTMKSSSLAIQELEDYINENTKDL